MPTSHRNPNPTPLATPISTHMVISVRHQPLKTLLPTLNVIIFFTQFFFLVFFVKFVFCTHLMKLK